MRQVRRLADHDAGPCAGGHRAGQLRHGHCCGAVHPLLRGSVVWAEPDHHRVVAADRADGASLSGAQP